ncbi:MAG: phosphoribosyltransferase family protein [Candidatus Omnitrophota bacterium]
MGKITILSDSSAAFRGREEAGRLLGNALRHLGGGSAVVVLGIPRGGVVIGKEVAAILESDLDIALSRKLGAPRNSELAIGAISETNRIFLDKNIAAQTGADETYIKAEAGRQLSEIRRRSGIFRKALPKTILNDKTVIIVDDGLATGATMQASLWAVREEAPARLIAGIPVASAEAVNRIAGSCDEVVCLRVPPFFGAVGEFYVNFEQTTDEAVIAILKEEFSRRRQ